MKRKQFAERSGGKWSLHYDNGDERCEYRFNSKEELLTFAKKYDMEVVFDIN